jgi:hypothetical protein
MNVKAYPNETLRVERNFQKQIFVQSFSHQIKITHTNQQ